jgi:hypothetical protein
MKQVDRPGHILNRETGEILELNDSLRRVKRLRKRVSRWGREIAEKFIRDGRGVMLLVSLTYRPGEVPQPGDRSEFMRKVRRKLGSKLIAYCVVAELQKRGVIHYHFLLLIRRGAWLPTPDKGHLWTHGSTNVKRNVRSPGYLLKYVSKVEEGGYELPIGTRAYDVRVRQVEEFSPGEIVALRLSAVPYWLEQLIREDCIDHGKFPARRRGGGWQLEGKVYPSPWVYVSEKKVPALAISSSVA